ncbi:MAG: signal recognition particle-docking protein FtsY [Nitrosopumilaceae archaeon]
MFENLRDAFSSAAKSLGERELREKDIEDVLFQLEISLLESDVATEVIDSIKSDLKKKLIGTKINKKDIEKFVKDSLIQTISSLFDSAGKIDIFSKITSNRDSGQPYIILFVGINGTGKTTTLAKLAYLLQKSKFSVVVAAADTFRAGAIEQLKEHTSRLNLKIVAQNYGSDPAAVARDAVLYAKSHKIDCVLVDTAGRMQTSKNLMDQITKIINVVKPDFKIFVGDSLAGNDTVNQAKEFHEHTKFDAAILTKSDADARGGAALSIVKVTSTPVIYVGVGQEYKDLKTFDKELFLETVFGKYDKNEISIAKEKVHEIESKIDSKQVEKTIPVFQQESESQAIVESSRDSEIPKEYDEIKPSNDSDPFEGLDTKDINLYADLFDAPPPENDQQAQELSVKIKKWISNGRPKTYDNSKEVDTHTMKDDLEKPKKKHSLFGRFKK